MPALQQNILSVSNPKAGRVLPVAVQEKANELTSATGGHRRKRDPGEQWASITPRKKNFKSCLIDKTLDVERVYLSASKTFQSTHFWSQTKKTQIQPQELPRSGPFAKPQHPPSTGLSSSRSGLSPVPDSSWDKAEPKKYEWNVCNG